MSGGGGASSNPNETALNAFPAQPSLVASLNKFLRRTQPRKNLLTQKRKRSNLASGVFLACIAAVSYCWLAAISADVLQQH